MCDVVAKNGTSEEWIIRRVGEFLSPEFQEKEILRNKSFLTDFDYGLYKIYIYIIYNIKYNIILYYI
mgnify:CR=1 FL=1